MSFYRLPRKIFQAPRLKAGCPAFKGVSGIREREKGLLSFQEDYPQATVVMLYCGKERLRIKGVLCLPCEEFLAALDPRKPFLDFSPSP